MPRPEAVRKNLSIGWRRLHRLWSLPLARKIEKAHQLLQRVLSRHKRPAICWSGGKDSGVLLHLALQHGADIPVIYVDSGVEFPETRRFVRRLSRLWKLNLETARPPRGETFWETCQKYGWPIFGKGIASNVERALRSGNVRKQLSEFERTLVCAQVRVSARCSEFVQERPSMRTEERLGIDVKLLGLRADESRMRVRLWVDHGDCYFVKRYFGRGRGIWKANPLAIWTEEDVWEYHEINNVPYCKLYDMGYPRNGCWPCAMGAKNGQLARLRGNHFRLFRKLVLDTPMGHELLKAKIVLSKGKSQAGYRVRDLASLIRCHPDAFDSF